MSLKYLKINSSDRENYSNSSTDFYITLSRPLRGMYRLVSSNIPVSHYNIGSNNNNIHFYEDSSSKTATLTNGIYSASELAALVKTSMDSKSGGHNTYTVNLNSNTQKLTISASNAFHFEWGTYTTNSARKIMGFSENDTASGTSVTSDNIINMNPVLSYNITIENYDNIESKSSSSTFLVPLFGNSTEICSYEPMSSFEQTINIVNPTKTFHIQLRDDNNNLLDLNGLDYYFVIENIKGNILSDTYFVS